MGGDVFTGQWGHSAHQFFSLTECEPDFVNAQGLGDSAQVIAPWFVDATGQILVNAFLGDAALPGKFDPRPSQLTKNL